MTTQERYDELYNFLIEVINQILEKAYYLPFLCKVIVEEYFKPEDDQLYLDLSGVEEKLVTVINRYKETK